jgi:hypothetical protein
MTYTEEAIVEAGVYADEADDLIRDLLTKPMTPSQLEIAENQLLNMKDAMERLETMANNDPLTKPKLIEHIDSSIAQIQELLDQVQDRIYGPAA